MNSIPSRWIVAVAGAGTVGLLLAACGTAEQSGASSTPAAPAKISVAAAHQTQPWNPSSPIVVTASGAPLESVSVTDTATGKTVPGKLSDGDATWTTSAPLQYGAHYKVDARTRPGDAPQATETDVIDTISSDATAYANVVPAPNLVADTGIGVGQPMVFQFTKPVTNKAEVQKHLVATTTPPQPGAWYWTDDKDVHYRAQNYWLPGTKIHIEANVFGLDLGNGVYGAEDDHADYTVHDSWVAKADGSTETLTVLHNGAVVKTMPTSLGSPGFPTHEGPHVISAKSPSIIMDSCTYGVCEGDSGYYREKVDWDLRLSNDGEFVHSAPWSVGQQGSSNVSHGCVNLSPANAEWMYDHFGIGDVVEIKNSGGAALPVWDTYGDWEVPWSTWQAGNAAN